MVHGDKVKVVFCCHPGVYPSLVLQELLLSTQIQVAGVVFSARLLRKDRPLWQDIPQLLKHSGLRYSCYQGLISQGHSLLQGLLKLPTPGSLCRKHHLPMLATRDINAQRSRDFVLSLDPDFILTGNFNQKLAPATLAIPARDCINLHPSLLPDYKGVEPVLMALAAGESDYGITLHQMQEDFDAGAILDQKPLPVVSGQCLFWHCLQAFREGAVLAREYLEAAGRGYTPRRQPEGGDYYGWPSPSEVARVKQLVRLKTFLSL